MFPLQPLEDEPPRELPADSENNKSVHEVYDQALADRTLETLGYTAELRRNRSTWNVVFMCFILSSVPYGVSTTFTYPLTGGGTANVIWGWVAVCLIILCVAASLAEITSVFPTAGGVYYQTFALSPPWCRHIFAWICGWAYTTGQIMITLSVNFSTTQFFIASLNVFEKSPGVGITDHFEAYHVFLIFLAITLLCHAVPTFGNKWLPWIEQFAIFLTIAGVVSIIVCILVLAKQGRHSADWVFTHFEPLSGWPAGWSFCVGLLQASWATSATGMIISMCEEVREPAVQVPKAMVGTVGINMIVGLALLIPFCFVLPDLSALIASGQPVPPTLKSATGSSIGAFCLLIPLLVLGLICGVGCATATSRCTWAFARDGAIPGSKWLKIVNNRLDIPLNAMMLGMIMEILLGLVYFGSSAAFSAFSGVGIILLTLSYACPVAVSLIIRRRRDIKHGSFHLGHLGTFCNIVTVAWTLLAIPLFCMPTYKNVTVGTMNYAAVVFVGIVFISALWYWVWGHENFAGPPTDGVNPYAEDSE
ncbi:Amino acid/polyamine transporter I [Penicillium nucicola]|uniref:Amino acid/polyamine transporter I n=1 Tax=Penicillium nucicola TaxID=1850975 RepID=UPI00254559BA|nr:Amino acid/polyamine transporter I [Penicillium nucicola]KAJ5766208.1 Amino acid/polyamine transporter I [Penicillium nucicola]